MKQRTIIMVTNNYTPYAGGVVSSLQVATQALRDIGYRVVIMTLDFLGTSPQEQDLVRIPCFVRFRWRKNHMAIPYRPSKALHDAIQKYKPAIVHVHHPFFLGNIAQRIAKKYHIPVVFTFHTLYECYLHYIPFPQWLTKLVVQHMVNSFCKKVDAIIAPSESIKRYIFEKFQCHASVVPSAILPCFIANKISQKAGTEDYIDLVTVSRFTKEKNIIFLLDMMKLLDDRYRLTLIGYGADQQALESYAFETLGLLQEQVHFIIKPAKEVIAHWYQKAHLFVFASTSETQGLVLAEAMAAGTPVIAQCGPGIVNIVEQAKNGFLIDSEQEMARQIEQVMNDPHLYVQLQKGAFETAKNYYPERAIQKLCTLYESLLPAVKVD